MLVNSMVMIVPDLYILSNAYNEKSTVITKALNY